MDFQDILVILFWILVLAFCGFMIYSIIVGANWYFTELAADRAAAGMAPLW